MGREKRLAAFAHRAPGLASVSEQGPLSVSLAQAFLSLSVKRWGLTWPTQVVTGALAPDLASVLPSPAQLAAASSLSFS